MNNSNLAVPEILTKEKLISINLSQNPEDIMERHKKNTIFRYDYIICIFIMIFSLSIFLCLKEIHDYKNFKEKGYK